MEFDKFHVLLTIVTAGYLISTAACDSNPNKTETDLVKTLKYYKTSARALCNGLKRDSSYTVCKALMEAEENVQIQPILGVFLDENGESHNVTAWHCQNPSSTCNSGAYFTCDTDTWFVYNLKQKSTNVFTWGSLASWD